MSENIVIKKMELLDCNIIEENFEEEFDNFWSISTLINEISQDNRYYFIIKREDNIIGFAGVMINDNNLEIMNIVIRKSERSQGYGKLLLEYIIGFFKDNHYRKIFLEVSEKNIHAIQLYKKCNFKQVGIRKKYYDNKYDALIMCYE